MEQVCRKVIAAGQEQRALIEPDVVARRFGDIMELNLASNRGRVILTQKRAP
jgi:hypothetical protein